MQLLRAVPLEGKLVTIDAGLLRRSVVQIIVADGGDYLGSLKGNKPEVKQVVETWLQANLPSQGHLLPAEAVEFSKGYGRIECREV